MLKDNAKYKIMVTEFNIYSFQPYTHEYNDVIYENYEEAVYQLIKIRNAIQYNKLICDVFLQEVYNEQK